MTQQKNIFKRWNDVPCHAFQPFQVRFLEGAIGASSVDHKEASCRLVVLVECHRHEGLDAELHLGGTGQTRKCLDGLAIASVPSEPRARALRRVPANCGVEIVQQEAVRSGQCKTVRCQAVTVTDFQAPQKNAFQVHIPEYEEGLLGAKPCRQLLEEKPQRLRQALLYLHGRRNRRKKMILRGKLLAVLAEKSQPR